MRAGTLLRLAWRDLKGGLARLWVVLACLALGVGLIAGVGGINAALVDALGRDAAKLLGGDLALESTNAPVPDAVIAAVPAGAGLSRTLRTNSIAFGADERSAPIEIKAVDGAYPLVGALGLDPPPAGTAPLLAKGEVAVEPLLLPRLGVRLGDALRVGDGTVRIAATVQDEPDRIASFVGTGLRVLMTRETLDGLGVLRPGALARYSDRIHLPSGLAPAAEAARLRAVDPDAAYQVREASSVQPRIERISSRIAAWLTLAGLASLLIGGLGIGLAVGTWLEGKTAAIATLKSIGARTRDVDRLLGVEVGLMAVVGILGGLVLGALLPQAVRLLPDGLVPVSLDPTIYPGPLALAALVGLLTAALFTLMPLARARSVPPARLFRDASLGGGSVARAAWPWLAVLALALALTVVFALPERWLGAGFVGVAALAALLLYALGRLVLGRLKYLAPLAPAALRLPLRRLARPGSGALAVTGALAGGLAALTLVTLIDATLRAEIEGGLPARVPDLVFIDIQPDQQAGFLREIEAAGGAVLQMTPILRGRVVRIKGAIPEPDKIGPEGRWTLQSDRGLTWQDEKPATTELVAGDWWPKGYDGPPLVSVEDEVAHAYGVKVGDTLGFNVLGRVVEAKVASLRREIDWSEGRLDFIFVFSPGLVANAPHTLVAAVDVPDDKAAALMTTAARDLPNVTPIAVGEVVAKVGRIMAQVGTALRAVAGVTLISGGLVLAAAIGAARARQAKEAVLLKVIGATRRQILWQMLAELALLGAVAGVLGVLIGTGGAYLAARFALHLPLAAAPLSVLGILALALALTLAIGSLGLNRLLALPAARALRAA